MNRSWALALLLVAGCTGNTRGRETGPNGDPPDDRTGGAGGAGMTGGAGGSASAGACVADKVPRVRTWRLTGTQFRNTVQAVFGYVGPASEQLPDDGQPDGFTNQADRLTVSPLLASRYLAATDEIAANVAGRAQDFLTCPIANLGTGSCLEAFLTTVAGRAWRRPLTPAEKTKYANLHATLVRGGNTPAAAFKGLVQALLLSPNFVFRTELGKGGAAGTTTRLTDHEVASALSYMLTDGPPDPALRELADGGKLGDAGTVAAQARRLLGAGPQASKIIGSFFRQWLQFDSLPVLTKDEKLFPGFTPEVVNDLLAESQALIDGVLFDAAGDRSLKTLLTTTNGYVNARTASLYGVQATGNTLVKTALPAAQRRGILTSAAFIAALSDSDDTNLPARGRIVREQVLCATVAPPPGNFQFEDPKITPDMTNREKLITHTTNPACASCHALFDGIGYAMEQYDAIGRFRATDKMKTIDSSGTLPLPGQTLTFRDYVDFVDQVAKLPDTYQCLAFQYGAFATGRAADEIPACERGPITEAFAAGGYRLEALVTAIVTSPNFAQRRN